VVHDRIVHHMIHSDHRPGNVPLHDAGMNATVQLSRHFAIAPVDPLVFGGFAEHLGRHIYEGIYDPGSPKADASGIRLDVLEAIKGLGTTSCRYPGGNFVSNYDWRDGIGPVAKRPRRPDYAWGATEPNTFGTDEFLAWCGRLGAAPMLAVNLGTGTARDAGEYLEYVNLPTGFRWSDERARNGHPDPYNVKLWCLGNEMDGPWQAGHVKAEEYASRARQAGKLMKGLDPSIKTIACGSSHAGMPTYLEWDRIILEELWDDIDYLSIHRYAMRWDNSQEFFLAEGRRIDSVIDDYRGLLGYVRGRKRSKRKIKLSFDEWNVWNTCGQPDPGPLWGVAKHQLEEWYTHVDSLVCAQFLCSFLRNADIVTAASLAQLVNVIAPIMTRKDGLVLLPTYHTIALIARLGRGVSLRPVVACQVGTVADKRGDHKIDSPDLDAAATLDGARLAVFLTNRTGKPLDVEVPLSALGRVSEAKATQVQHDDLMATNTFEKPDTVVPRPLAVTIDGDRLCLTLPAYAFAAVEAQVTG
jgi:alpha-N-arabinofuranosidase